jgi:hypothetical protein
MSLLSRLLVAVAFAASAACGRMEQSSRARPGDGAVIYQSTILTMDPRQPGAEAVIVKDGVIVDVGGIDDLVQSYPGAAFDERFLRRTLTPAFVDVRLPPNSAGVIQVPCQGALLSEEVLSALLKGAPFRVVALGQAALSSAIEAARRIPADAPIGRLSIEVRGAVASEAAELLTAINVPLILSGEPLPDTCDPPPRDGDGDGDARVISGVIAIAPAASDDRFLAAASERLLDGGSVRLSAQEALEAITVDAAFALGEETSRGVIAPGRRADFAVLDRNPLATPGDGWGAISVEIFSTSAQ